MLLISFLLHIIRRTLNANDANYDICKLIWRQSLVIKITLLNIMTDIIHFFLLSIYLSCPYPKSDNNIKKVDKKTLLWIEESRRTEKDQEGLVSIKKDRQGSTRTSPGSS